MIRARAAIVALSLASALAGLAPAQDFPGQEWPAADARSLGLDRAKLDAFAAEIGAGKYGYVDSMLVIRRGKIAFDRSFQHDYDRIYGQEARTKSPLNPLDPSGPYNYFNPWWHPYYRRGDLHTMQSVTKTITSVIIGVAVTRKEFPSLDTPVLQFFDAAKIANVDERKRRMTIRHLLTMTAGLDWNENLPYADPRNTAIVMEASFDWVQYAIDRPMAQEPGAAFNYNSGASQILSHIFRAATGKDMEEYARQHLFAPLGIERFYWKRTPTGLVDTEGGLYLRAPDLARIAYLFLRNGMWGKTRILNEIWVNDSVAPHIDTGAGGVKYGYKWWLPPYGKDGARRAWAGSGFGGQRPVIIPEYDLIVVFTGWNILPGKPALGPGVALNRVLDAVLDTTP